MAASTNQQLQHCLERLKTPPQDLAELSFCSARTNAVERWAQELPATNATQTAKLLYNALPEIVHLQAPAATRLSMLEGVRPYVHQAIDGLSRQFLNQPLLLPEPAMRSATLALALHKHMSNGYVSLLKQRLARGDWQKDKALVIQAIHRALNGLGLQVLRNFQLYTTPPEQVWQELNALYRLAELLGIDQDTCPDQLNQHPRPLSIRHVYLRILLLSCSRPNQLRQVELLNIYHALEQWVLLAQLSPLPRDSDDALHVIDLDGDQGPCYQARLDDSQGGERREIVPQRLVDALHKQLDQGDSGDQQFVAIPLEISRGLLDHLLGAWTVRRQRNFERRANQATITVTVGLTGLHYQLSGQRFDDFINQGDPSLEEEPTFASFDDPEPAAKKTGPPTHIVQLRDSSPGGYCLRWQEAIPAQVRAGEILGLKEAGRTNWSIGVIRWLRQTKDATLLGIELLSPTATAYSASMTMETGAQSEPMRALLLPELKVANRPASLLTLPFPFQEYAKVRLGEGGKETLIQLRKRLLTTPSISQFTFQSLEKAGGTSGGGGDPWHNF